MKVGEVYFLVQTFHCEHSPRSWKRENANLMTLLIILMMTSTESTKFVFEWSGADLSTKVDCKVWAEGGWGLTRLPAHHIHYTLSYILYIIFYNNISQLYFLSYILYYYTSGWWMLAQKITCSRLPFLRKPLPKAQRTQALSAWNQSRPFTAWSSCYKTPILWYIFDKEMAKGFRIWYAAGRV